MPFPNWKLQCIPQWIGLIYCRRALAFLYIIILLQLISLRARDFCLNNHLTSSGLIRFAGGLFCTFSVYVRIYYIGSKLQRGKFTRKSDICVSICYVYTRVYNIDSEGYFFFRSPTCNRLCDLSGVHARPSTSKSYIYIYRERLGIDPCALG